MAVSITSPASPSLPLPHLIDIETNIKAETDKGRPEAAFARWSTAVVSIYCLAASSPDLVSPDLASPDLALDFLAAFLAFFFGAIFVASPLLASSLCAAGAGLAAVCACTRAVDDRKATAVAARTMASPLIVFAQEPQDKRADDRKKTDEKKDQQDQDASKTGEKPESKPYRVEGADGKFGKLVLHQNGKDLPAVRVGDVK